jgi:hypothetical protein
MPSIYVTTAILDTIRGAGFHVGWTSTVDVRTGELRRESLVFAVMLDRIQRLGVPPPLVQRGGRGERTRGWRLVGAEADAARKRAGMVVPEAAGAGLARWSDQTGGFTAREVVFS